MMNTMETIVLEASLIDRFAPGEDEHGDGPLPPAESTALLRQRVAA